MRNRKRYSEITEREYQTIENTTGKRGRAKFGHVAEMRDARELFEILRNATYIQIGIGNALRRAASDFSALDGSNWRNNRRAAGRVAAVAEKLYRTEPSDVDALIKLEDELEQIYLDATRETKQAKASREKHERSAEKRRALVLKGQSELAAAYSAHLTKQIRGVK